MKGLRLLGKEWQHILSKTQARIGIAILLLIPLIYAGIFLGGYWDPYGHLDELPVAVVNDDQGAQMDGKTLHIGDDLVAKLKESGTLDFRFVSKEEARSGLEEGRYYMSVIIPDSFSDHVTTLTSGDPQAAQLEYYINPGHNFVAGQIGSSAVEKLKDQVGDEITRSYTETVFGSLKKLFDGLGQAGGGADELNRGIAVAQAGVVKLQDGASELAAGAGKLEGASSKLSEGETKLQSNMNVIRNGAKSLSEGLSALDSSHQKLEQSSEAVSGGMSALAAAVQSAADSAGELKAQADVLQQQLAKLKAEHPELAQDASIIALDKASEELQTEVGTVSASEADLAEGLKRAEYGQAQLMNGMAQFGRKLAGASDSGKTLAEGMAALSTGMKTWDQGFTTYTDGVDTLAAGVSALKDGAAPLAAGMVKLVDGSSELAAALNDAAAQASSVRSDAKTVTMFARPVQLEETKVNDVPNYGTAMVPYFLTLGLFVGGLIASNILPYERKSKYGVSGWHHFVNKYGLFLSIAVLQTLIVDGVLLLGLGIEVQSVPKFMLLSFIASFAYFTCILMLVSVIGPLGRLVAVFLLVTQLATSGGTFPMELAIAPMQAVSGYLPMTYAVNAFRAAVSTGDWGQYWSNTGILAAYIAAFVAIALLVLVKSNAKPAGGPAAALQEA
ncbi:putative membrane protein [Paenibacillus phyllosphaerae]|uniref:Putative membrane protein n=1 Tax=Paenibacillus phyllosphaerae TaxID=274593 RepID=A0A7W5FRE3_9BACL|nr:YhgE/Pip domain-containing protein [Paenibacillus phyllosphaerae]MBB3114222.1 putative membrane protein [Paenibacillus phyllosphaerae]